ncbi:MAG: type II toxin-antitoxin system HicB family antitoxin [Nitrospirota bacterium]
MKAIMTYKGYTGSAHFSAEDKVFHGKVEGIKDLIRFEGRDVENLKDAFHEAVDDYIEHSRAKGREPKSPYSLSIFHPAAAQRSSYRSLSVDFTKISTIGYFVAPTFLGGIGTTTLPKKRRNADRKRSRRDFITSGQDRARSILIAEYPILTS